jgi:hypothetical protein
MLVLAFQDQDGTAYTTYTHDVAKVEPWKLIQARSHSGNLSTTPISIEEFPPHQTSTKHQLSIHSYQISTSLNNFHITSSSTTRILETMYFSIPILTLLITAALGASIKRQNDVPDCITGDTSEVNRPGKSIVTLAPPTSMIVDIP